MEIAAIAGKDIVISILTTSISTTTSLISNLIKNNNNVEILKEYLHQSDLKNRLEIIECVSKRVDHTKEPINLAWNSLTEIVKIIHTLLEEISEKIKYHESKYFSSWRSIDISSEVSRLEKLNKILESRISLFFEVFKVFGTEKN